MKLSRKQKADLLDRLQRLRDLLGKGDDLWDEYTNWLEEEWGKDGSGAHQRYSGSFGGIISGIVGLKGFLTEGADFDFDRVDAKQLDNFNQAVKYADKLITQAEEGIQTWQEKQWLKSV